MGDFGVHRDRVLANFDEFQQSRLQIRRNRLHPVVLGPKNRKDGWRSQILRAWTKGQIHGARAQVERVIAAFKTLDENAQVQLEHLRASVKGALEFVRTQYIL